MAGSNKADPFEGVVDEAFRWLNLPKRQRDAWRHKAECRGMDTALFYPDRGVNCSIGDEICNQCPVQKTCLAVGLLNSERFGVWGGLTVHQRRGMKTALNEALRSRTQVA